MNMSLKKPFIVTQRDIAKFLSDDPVWLYYSMHNTIVQISFPNRYLMAKYLVRVLGRGFAVMGEWFTSSQKCEYPFI